MEDLDVLEFCLSPLPLPYLWLQQNVKCSDILIAAYPSCPGKLAFKQLILLIVFTLFCNM